MLRMGGFDGEGVQSGAVLVVKTHSSTPMWTKVRGQLEFNAKVSPIPNAIIIVIHGLVWVWFGFGLGFGLVRLG